jgi:ribosomal protein S18 acetylase RimI-like enzyme
MSFQIKEATVEESDLIFHVMVDSFKEYDRKLNPPSGALLETVDKTIQTFQIGGGAVLAWEGDVVAGSARYKPVDHYMYIGRVSVRPEFRGKGIMKAMLNTVENIAKTRGLMESRVEVRLSIPSNIDMYERMHYEVIEHKFYPERIDSWYVMRKML